MTVKNNSAQLYNDENNYGSITVMGNAIIDSSLVTGNSDNGIIVSENGSFAEINNSIISNNNGYGVWCGRDDSTTFTISNSKLSLFSNFSKV